MPIPGDNGHPEEEMDKQEDRITKVANKGADIMTEVHMVGQEPKKRNIFGIMG